jgi:hypothetical protein
MWKRMLSASALAVAVAAAVAVLGLASSSTGNDRSGTTLQVFADGITNADVDFDGDGKWSLGDTRVTRWTDLDRAGGTKIGAGRAVCTAAGSAGNVLSCIGSDSFPRGTLIWQGVRDASLNRPRYRWAITGGTGKYRNARGQKYDEILSPTTSQDTYELSPNGLDPSLSPQNAYDYMGRPPERYFQLLGVPCALWSGGRVPDPDPWWKKSGGKRATWTVQVCWTVPVKVR